MLLICCFFNCKLFNNVINIRHTTGRFWPENGEQTLGTVGEVRGKIIGVTRGGAPWGNFGIPKTSFHVQNTWELEADEKWPLVLQHLTV